MKSASFRRKVIYGGIMVLLLVPLYRISSPSFQNAAGQLSPGGLLTRERRAHGLSQSNLGDIAPASESMTRELFRPIRSTLIVWRKTLSLLRSLPSRNLNDPLPEMTYAPSAFVNRIASILLRLSSWPLMM